MLRTPHSTPALLNALHPQLVALEWKLLQPFVFGDSVESHIAELLRVADFPKNARVLDVGCGIGECARLMTQQRPDLQFVLLNFSEAQLADCPPEYERYLADAHAMPFVDGEFDAVMFNAALCNMDAQIALAEASRVLKRGGVVLLNDFELVRECDDKLLSNLHCVVHPETKILELARNVGLTLSTKSVERGRFATEFESLAASFAGVDGAVWRLVKNDEESVAALYGNLFSRHDNVALSLSGGKDSLACLYLFKPYWDRLTVYWMNPGDPFPETVDFMNKIRKMVPNFVELHGLVKQVHRIDGWPSDVVPHSHTTDGNTMFGSTDFKVQTRESCCFRSLMKPAYQAMLADGVTCCIRGKRKDETDRTGLESGFISPEGVELQFPIYNWSSADVKDYLAAKGVDLPRFYAYADASFDCMSCTAWWGEGLSKYLKAEHPVQFEEYSRRVTLIKGAVAEHMKNCEV